MTKTRLLGAVRLVTCIAALAVAAGGCTAAPGSTATPPDSGTAAGGGGNGNVAAVWREFVACARENGQQNMPDPKVHDDGSAEFPPTAGFSQKDAFDAVRQSCGTILDRLPPEANPMAAPSANADQMVVLRRYVQCMRDNGLPQMPDPGPNGELNDPPNYDPDGPMAAARNAARDACDRILTDEYRR